MFWDAKAAERRSIPVLHEAGAKAAERQSIPVLHEAGVEIAERQTPRYFIYRRMENESDRRYKAEPSAEKSGGR